MTEKNLGRNTAPADKLVDETAAKEVPETDALPENAFIATQQSKGVMSAEDVEKIKADMAAQAAAMQETLTSNASDRIRPNGSIDFTLPDGTKATDFDCIILGWSSLNVYYENPYDEHNIESPICWATNRIPTQLAPEVEKVQNMQNDTCNGCAWNEFKSAKNKRGKACSNNRLVYVIMHDSNSPISERPIMQIKVSPTSLATFDRYVTSITQKSGAMPYALVTKVSLDKTSTFSKVMFELVEPLTTDEIIATYMRQQDANTLIDSFSLAD